MRKVLSVVAGDQLTEDDLGEGEAGLDQTDRVTNVLDLNLASVKDHLVDEWEQDAERELVTPDHPDKMSAFPMPQATMDCDGYLTFTSKCIALDSSPVDGYKHGSVNPAQPECVEAVDGSR